MLIAEDKIEEVRACSDVVDVISDFVRLKKRGTNFVGLCPFHNEKSPSFNVNPRMQIFKCFGCGAGGNVFQFLMRMENTTFPEAVRALADRANVHIPEDNVADRENDPTEAVYHALRFAARFFYDQLTQYDEGAEARTYLTDKRHLSTSSITKFGLGYAPSGWTTLADAAERAGIAADSLEMAGLVLKRKDGSSYYDRYRNRVIFPIFSKVGRVIGFGGRVLDPEDEPKYINSPETIVYHKSRELYGLFQAKQAIRKKGEVLMVEGYTDVISLAQAGIENVVASSGTALTVEQVRSLKQYCDRVVLVYDADSAGAGATIRGIDILLENGVAAYVVQLPDGEDPDTFVAQVGAEGFESYMREHRDDFVAFKYRVAVAEAELSSPESEADGYRSVVESISRISDTLVRDRYVKRASEVMGMPDITIYEVLDGLRKQRRSGRPRRSVPIEIGAEPENAPTDPVTEYREPLPEEKTLLRLMLEFGTPIVEYVLSHMSLDEFTEGASRTMAAAVLEMYQEGLVDRNRILDGTFGESVQNLSAEVLSDVHEPSVNWQRKKIAVPRLHDDPKESASSAMTLLKLDRVDAAIEQEHRRLGRFASDREKSREIQQRIIDLQNARKAIESREFLVWKDLSA